MTTGLNFLHDGLAKVLPQIIEEKYPGIVFTDFVTVDNEASPYLDRVIRMANISSADLDAGLITDNTTTFKSIDVGFSKIEVPLAGWGMTVGWTLREVKRAQELGQAVDTARISSLNKVAYQTLQKVAFLGHAQDKNITGLLNNKNVKSMPSGFGKAIKDMSYDEAIKAFTTLFDAIVAQTGNIQAPNTIAIDYGDYSALSLLTKPGESSLTAIQFLETSFSKIAGHEVKFKRIPSTYATKAKAGKTRLLAYYNDPGYVIWDVPMTPQFTGPAPDKLGQNFELLAEMVFGAVCFLEPLSAMYVDY